MANCLKHITMINNVLQNWKEKLAEWIFHLAIENYNINR